MEVDSKKLEFMASLNLVPPAVLEEIHRRQMLCRVELGNWWERQHSKDFCLVQRSTGQTNSVVDLSLSNHHPIQSPVEVQTINVAPNANGLELVQISRPNDATPSQYTVQQSITTTPTPQNIFTTANFQ